MSIMTSLLECHIWTSWVLMVSTWWVPWKFESHGLRRCYDRPVMPQVPFVHKIPGDANRTSKRLRKLNSLPQVESRICLSAFPVLEKMF